LSRADLVRSGDRFSRTLSFLEEHDLLDRLLEWGVSSSLGAGADDILADLCAALDIEVWHGEDDPHNHRSVREEVLGRVVERNEEASTPPNPESAALSFVYLESGHAVAADSEADAIELARVHFIELLQAGSGDFLVESDD
jgi:hypothetical protein